jgi:hypothetical protein
MMSERMEQKLDKFIDNFADFKVKMTEDVGSIKTTMAVNTSELAEHIKRTGILEKRVEPMWVSYKLVGAVVGFSFIAAAVVEVAGYFKK